MSGKVVFSAIVLFVLTASLVFAQGTVTVDSFFSESLQETREARVYLPEGYDQNPDHVYPIVYFLHGANGDATDPNYDFVIEVLDELIANQSIQPVVMVMPDGSAPPFAGSMWTNSELYGAFEDYVVEDVAQYMESAYRVRSDRFGRGISGYSMGGIGCMTIALAHAEEYCAVASNSGALDFEGIPVYFFPVVLDENGGSPPYEFNPGAGLFTYLVYTLCGGYSPNLTNPPYYLDFPLDVDGEIVPDVVARWMEHNPTVLAADVAPGELGLYFNCGTEDELFFYPMNESFAATLTDLGHTFTFEVDGGTHFSVERYDRVRSALQFVDGFFQDVVAVENPDGMDQPALTPEMISIRNAPNPFNPQTKISFTIPVTDHARVQVVDLSGKLVATLVDGVVAAGEKEVLWNGRDSAGREVPSGLYFSRLESGGRVVHGRMTLVR